MISNAYQEAISAVQKAQGDAKSWADQAISVANSAISAAGNVTIGTPPLPPEADIPEFSPDYAPPSMPPAPNGGPAPPGIPSLPSLNFPQLVLPTNGAQAPAPPDISLPAAPSSAPALDLPTAPELSAIDLPTAPELTPIASPSLDPIAMPTAPALSIPEFTAQEPVPPSIPNAPVFDVQDSEDTGSSLDLEGPIQRMLDGEGGLPPEVEQALFDRARVREDLTAAKLVDETMTEWSARGFSLPQGELARRVSEARQKNQDAANALSREMMIRQHQERVESLRQAVTQGITLHGTLLEAEHRQAERKIRIAEIGARLAIEHFNTLVSAYNAQVSLFNMRAEVYRARLSASAQRLELYKGELEAARVKGEINEQRVRVFSELVRAQFTAVEVFKAQIDGARAQSDFEQAKIARYRAVIDGQAARIEAYKSEVQAWAERVRAEGTKADIYRASVSAFAERIRAHSVNVEAEVARFRGLADVEKLKLDAYVANVNAIKEQTGLLVENARLTAAVFDGQVRVATAHAGLEESKMRALAVAHQGDVQAAVAKSQAAVEHMKAAAENLRAVAQIAASTQLGIAQVSGQMAAGAMSALNASASISGSGGVSESYDYSYRKSRSISGQITVTADGGETDNNDPNDALKTDW